MLSRRSVLKAGLGPCSCWVCGSPAIVNTSLAAQADQPIHIQGSGYDLRFVGDQRETIMNGKLAAALDLRTLERTPHLYGIGPIEQLRGEVTIAASRPSLARVRPDGSIGVTESFEAGAPFLVWAQVPVWRALPIPPEVRSFADLEAFVPRSAASVGLDPHKPLPFLIRGCRCGRGRTCPRPARVRTNRRYEARPGTFRNLVQAGCAKAFRPRDALPAFVLVSGFANGVRGCAQGRSRMRYRLLGHCAE